MPVFLEVEVVAVVADTKEDTVLSIGMVVVEVADLVLTIEMWTVSEVPAKCVITEEVTCGGEVSFRGTTLQ